MAQITAQLNNYRQSPRKVRLVADAIRGKKVADAKNILKFVVKRATGPMDKLLNSAISNAKNSGLDAKDLFVKAISVNQGDILYRRRPVWHGMANPIRKRTSHIKIILSDEPKSPKGASKK